MIIGGIAPPALIRPGKAGRKGVLRTPYAPATCSQWEEGIRGAVRLAACAIMAAAGSPETKFLSPRHKSLNFSCQTKKPLLYVFSLAEIDHPATWQMGRRGKTVGSLKSPIQPEREIQTAADFFI